MSRRMDQPTESITKVIDMHMSLLRRNGKRASRYTPQNRMPPRVPSANFARPTSAHSARSQPSQLVTSPRTQHRTRHGSSTTPVHDARHSAYSPIAIIASPMIRPGHAARAPLASPPRGSPSKGRTGAWPQLEANERPAPFCDSHSSMADHLAEIWRRDQQQGDGAKFWMQLSQPQISP